MSKKNGVRSLIHKSTEYMVSFFQSTGLAGCDHCHTKQRRCSGLAVIRRGMILDQVNLCPVCAIQCGSWLVAYGRNHLPKLRKAKAASRD